jgi:Atypical PilZ domain, cyclic di-GMP receptor
VVQDTPDPTAAFDGLHHPDTLPFEFRPLDRSPEPAQLARLASEATQVLIAEGSLDDQRAPVESKPDDDQPLFHEIQRIEFKLNVLIELVGRLVADTNALPPARAYRLYATGMEWLGSPGETQVGEVGIVALHVSRRFPHPLELPGRVIGLREDAAGTWLQLQFIPLNAAVTDLLAKYIFRRHRRTVAGTRVQSRT